MVSRKKICGLPMLINMHVHVTSQAKLNILKITGPGAIQCMYMTVYTDVQNLRKILLSFCMYFTLQNIFF